MSFVDELNKMPSLQNEAGKKNENEIDQELITIHGIIREVCKNKRDKKRIDGFIVRYYDKEYSQHGFRWVESLQRADIDEYAHRLDKFGTKYYSSVVSDLFEGKPKGLSPISSNKTECDNYCKRLYQSLVEDGFINIELVSHGCYAEYFTVKDNFLKGIEKAIRNSTNMYDVLGYVIRISLNW